MNVQIGDTVLVQPAKGIQFPAMVLHIGFQLKIDCVGFTLAGHTRFLVSVPYVESIKTLEGLDYWDFRPSQKEPPIPEPPRNLSEVLKDALKNIDVEITDEKSIEKLIEERYGRDLEIKNQGIKLHPSLLKPPAIGTFEWALVALKNGHKVRRSCWYKQVLVVRIEGSYLRFVIDGSLYTPNSIDLLATDWVLA